MLCYSFCYLFFCGIVWDAFGPAISCFCLGVLFEIFMPIYTSCVWDISFWVAYILFAQNLSSLFLKQFSVGDITTSFDREFQSSTIRCE